MATVINNPPSGDSDSGMGSMIGIIALIIVIVLLIFYGLPMLRGGAGTPAPTTTNQPEGRSEVNLEVPDSLDVNVNPGNAEPGTGE
jgi:hypothetical protein